MTTPSSSGQELPADGLPPASGRRRRAKPQKRADFRTQAAESCMINAARGFAFLAPYLTLGSPPSPPGLAPRVG